MNMWGAVQNVSLPMLLCQEMSQIPPTEAEVMAMTQVVMYHGTGAVRSAAWSAQVIVAL
jgi:hypothetical protein